MARIIFTKTHPMYGDFTDAIEVPAGVSEQYVEDLKDQRFRNWITAITTPAPELPAEDPPAEG